MSFEVIMPKMGESITDGTILEWKKSVGDTILKDEVLLEISTDKVDSEIPSSAAGIIVDILAEPNDVKAVGEVIAKIDTGGNSSIVGKVNLKKDEGPEHISQVSENKPEQQQSIPSSKPIFTENKEKKWNVFKIN